jgi:hypothetical protein
MPAYSKGTRSKGVHRQFNSAAQVGNQQKSKKARVHAYLNKEAFMKEALARHMAVEEARVQAALNPDAAAATDAGTSADVVAAAAAPAPVASIKPAPKTTPGGGKLRSKIGVEYMQGALRWEGKGKKGGGKAEAIGHLMKPLKGDEEELGGGRGGTVVDTETKLPVYARGKATIQKKKKKNKRKNARAARGAD